MDKDKLSVEDAILAMQVYEWSPDEIIAKAQLGNLAFDVYKFLKKVKKINGTSAASRAAE